MGTVKDNGNLERLWEMYFKLPRYELDLICLDVASERMNKTETRQMRPLCTNTFVFH